MDFYNKYPGWEAAAVLQEIREEFSHFFQRKVDIANKNALRGKHSITGSLCLRTVMLQDSGRF